MPALVGAVEEGEAAPAASGGGAPLLDQAFLEGAVAQFGTKAPAEGQQAHAGAPTAFAVKHLNIVDPLLPTNNLGRSVSKASFARIRRAFAHGAATLDALLLKVRGLPAHAPPKAALCPQRRRTPLHLPSPETHWQSTAPLLQDPGSAIEAFDLFFKNTWKSPLRMNAENQAFLALASAPQHYNGMMLPRGATAPRQQQQQQQYHQQQQQYHQQQQQQYQQQLQYQQQQKQAQQQAQQQQAQQQQAVGVLANSTELSQQHTAALPLPVAIASPVQLAMPGAGDVVAPSAVVPPAADPALYADQGAAHLLPQLPLAPVVVRAQGSPPLPLVGVPPGACCYHSCTRLSQLYVQEL